MKHLLLLLILLIYIPAYSQIEGYDIYKIGQSRLSKTICNCSYEYEADSSICIATDWDSYINATNDVSDIDLRFFNDTLYSIEFSPSQDFLKVYRAKYGAGNKWTNKNIEASFSFKTSTQLKADFLFKTLMRMKELQLRIHQLEYDVKTVYTIEQTSKAVLEVKELDLRNNMIGYNGNRLIIIDKETAKRVAQLKKNYKNNKDEKRKAKISGKI